MLGSNLLGIGQKSGVYWALDPDDGSVVWQTQVGPPGILWGTAFDGTSIYVPISNADYVSYPLQPGGAHVQRMADGDQRCHCAGSQGQIGLRK